MPPTPQRTALVQVHGQRGVAVAGRLLGGVEAQEDGRFVDLHQLHGRRRRRQRRGRSGGRVPVVRPMQRGDQEGRWRAAAQCQLTNFAELAPLNPTLFSSPCQTPPNLLPPPTRPHLALDDHVGVRRLGAGRVPAGQLQLGEGLLVCGTETHSIARHGKHRDQ